MKDEGGKWRLLFGLLCAIVIAFAVPVFADNGALINSPDWPLYQWFASTDKKHENEDYIVAQTGRAQENSIKVGNFKSLVVYGVGAGQN